MKMLILICVVLSFAFGAFAQKPSVNKTELRAELAAINRRISESISNDHKRRFDYHDSETGKVTTNAVQLEDRLVSFSGCTLSFAKILKHPSKDHYSEQRVVVFFKDLDVNSTLLLVRDRRLTFQVSTTGRKILINQLMDGKSPSTGIESQRTSTLRTSRYTFSFTTDVDPQEIQRDIGRAIEICKQV